MKHFRFVAVLMLMGFGVLASSSAAVASETTGEIYSANAGTGDVSVVDAQTLTTLARIPVFRSMGSTDVAYPTSVMLTPDHKYALVALFQAQTMAVIATASRTVVHYIDIDEVGGDPQVFVTADGQRAFITAGTDFTTMAVLDISNPDVTQWTRINQIELAAGAGYPMAFSPDGATAYVGTAYTGDVGIVVFTVADNAVTGFIPTSQPVVDLAVSLDGTVALVAGVDRVLAIDLATGTEALVMCGAAPCHYGYSSSVVFTANGARAVVVDNGTNELVVLDTTNLTSIKEISRTGLPISIASRGMLAWEVKLSNECAYVAAYNSWIGALAGPSAVVAFNLSSGVPIYSGYGLVGDWSYQLDAWGSPSCVPAVLDSSITTLMATPSHAFSGDPIALTATVTGTGGTPIGNVVFLVNDVLVGMGALDGSGQASIDVGTLPDGVHSITVRYSGDEIHAASGHELLVIVGTVATSTSVLASRPTSGGPVTLTAMAASIGGTPTGAVSFSSDLSGPLGTATLDGSGRATLTLPTLTVGNHTITAVYGGQGSFAASSGTTTLAINPAIEGRMSGLGTFGNPKVSYGFTLNCEAQGKYSYLLAKWGNGKTFNLEHVTSAVCLDDPANPSRPRFASFDTYRGTGTGRYNGAPATAEWVFTDGGETGRDTASLVIRNAAGAVVLATSGQISGFHIAFSSR